MQKLRKFRSAARTAEQITRTGLSKVGIDRHYVKVFAIGFNKTATTSIDTLFGNLGYRARYHGVAWRPKNAYRIHWKYQAFSDGKPEDFRKLDERFPKSRFILNTRDPLEWLDSRYQHVKSVRQGGPNWQPTPEAVEAWIIERNNYHLKVLEYFTNRPDDLLIINFIRDPMATRKIADFLGRSDDGEKPYTRSTQKTREKGHLKNAEVIKSALRRLNVDETEWKYDLFFPSLTASDLPYDTSLTN